MMRGGMALLLYPFMPLDQSYPVAYARNLPEKWKDTLVMLALRAR